MVEGAQLTFFMAWVTLIWLSLRPELFIRLRSFFESTYRPPDSGSTTGVDPPVDQIEGEVEGEDPNRLDRYV